MMKYKSQVNISKYFSIKPKDATADVFIPETLDDILIFTDKEDDFYVLAGGTNIIAGKVEKPVLMMNFFEGGSETNEFGEKSVRVFLTSSIKISNLLKYCVENGLSGIEFMAGIPGTIGGALCGNAAPKDYSWDGLVLYYQIIKDGKIMKIEPEFAYRKVLNLPKPPFVILGAEIVLLKTSSDFVKANIKTFLKRRLKIGFPSAGSLFKNPENKSAGKLLEEVGMKGFSINDASLFEKHANIVINKGNASYRDFEQLVNTAYFSVRDKFSIELEREVKFWGGKE